MTGLSGNPSLKPYGRAPDFFDKVRERARRTWNQLDSDPDLAGPWKQLFAQVQSPRHVLSELLQNADDAGAKHARASIVDGSFVFEHDGEDFDEEELSSLCKFGFSNKRKLHTIGFRGIGFKSTFSLGDTVDVLTPSLAVRFHKRRFTEPVWINDTSPVNVTRVTMKIQDPNRERELKKNLEEWVGSPTSLLFFNSICELTIGNVTLRKEILGPGPVMDSERVRLTTCGERELLIIRSPEEVIPEDAISEIRQERNTSDLHLPPCRVELVVGLPGEQRLYVVLPTGVKVGLPFSCNAPFLQDPARTAIKNPSMSPTNRWLLSRLGRLAGDTLCNWLQNASLPLDVRARAYCLLPEKAKPGDSIEADAVTAICQGFIEATGDTALLLTTAGSLVKKEECLALPKEVYSVWPPSDLLNVFGHGQKHVLCETIVEQAQRRLQSWEKLDLLDANAIVDGLMSGQRVPRPDTFDRLLHLWCLVQKAFRNDYDTWKRRRLAIIIPVEGQDTLSPARDVIRLSSKKETVSDEGWEFLSKLVLVIDRQWVEYLGKATNQNADFDAGRQLLSDLNLERPSDANEVARNACRRLFARSNVELEDCVRIAHVMAALDARTPDEFLCVTMDGKQRKPSEGVIAAPDAGLADLFPQEWRESHFLHKDYFSESKVCTKWAWQDWMNSPKSNFAPFSVLRDKVTTYWSRGSVERLLQSRQAEKPQNYPYVRGAFEFHDFDFDDILLKNWEEAAREEPGIWGRVLERVVSAPYWYWKDRTHAILKQHGNVYIREVSCGPILSTWIMRFSTLRCLPDTQGEVRAATELYLRTPETEPLLGVEPFVRAELDTEATKPLLRLLGVRDTPAGLDKLIGRIRALAGAPDPLPLLHEIIKWYGALDRVLARCSSTQLKEAREIFQNERLILTNSGEWTTSSEVFQRVGDEDLPDLPMLHSSIQDYSMWSRLGVAERPSAQLVLDWLYGLKSGGVLDPADLRYVRSALQHYPIQIWESCHHWLALDNSWVPVDQLRYRLTMHSLTKWGDLFPAVKSRTANMQMLSAEICNRHPLSSLPDLSGNIEYRLPELPRNLGSPVEKTWLAAIARFLQRVNTGDEAETNRIREIASRMSQSVWQPFKTISVTPYIDGAPAGQPHSPDVLWHEKTIFVRDGRLARSFGALVNELSRPFANAAVSEAIKACIERDEDFITDYMEEHFELEEAVALAPSTTSTGQEQPEDDGNGEMEGPGDKEDGTEDITPDETQEPHPPGSDEDEKPETERSGRKPRQPLLFERFTAAHGYSWTETKGRFVHPDGSWIERCESPFHWRRFDVTGNITICYWASQQCLSRGGVEIAAELWDLIRANPEGCCLILVDEDDRPKEISGVDIIQMVKDKRITLYPAKYRIREDAGT
ncbi:MAG: hypothetical protein C4532_05115 [Candidatus Abyssobacteria bacterium SURF_17]|uniref:ATPase n=1 Tax=Candidatus Abyssobacteria bacterium SURF_17 TaxID=2093361 RepID=A0A419F3L5_9BACT|nr:MAG: hypothetical protein C4532_05115 [Candidatus Abyssubacteria bacterium SURF_17]